MAFCLSPKLSLWLGFAVSLPAAMISGLEMAFNVYALPLKETFNFTQTQVEIVASMGTVGLGLGCLEWMCTWFLGYRVTCLIISVGMPVSSGVFALAAYYSTCFHHWPSLVSATQLLLSTLNCMGYFAVSRVCIELFPKKHTGKLIGLYMAVCCFGKIYFAGLIELFFNTNLAGFFLSISLLSVFGYGTCFFLLYPFATDEKEQLEVGLPAEETEECDMETTVTSREMLKSTFFHVTFWSSVVFYGCGYTSVNNITAVAESVGTEDPLKTVFVMSVVIFIVRLTFGLLFDKSPSLWCGFALLTTSYCAFILSLCIGMFVLDAGSIILEAVLIGIGMAPGITIPVSILLLRFGRKHYSSVSGCFYAGSSACQIMIQMLIGFFYDSEISAQGLSGRICYGRWCFYWPFCTMLVITLVVSLTQTVNFVLSTHYRKMAEWCRCIRQLLGSETKSSEKEEETGELTHMNIHLASAEDMY